VPAEQGEAARRLLARLDAGDSSPPDLGAADDPGSDPSGSPA
jgi:hypothetical protein